MRDLARVEEEELTIAHQYIQPTANPTPRSRNLRGNSTTGALTGIRAVISPKQDITDETTVPIIMYAMTAPPGPAPASDLPLPRKSPLPIVLSSKFVIHMPSLDLTLGNIPRECYHLAHDNLVSYHFCEYRAQPYSSNSH